MATANRRAKKPARRPVPGNRREKPSVRRVKAATRAATYRPERTRKALPEAPPGAWVALAKTLAGLVLVPVAFLTAQTFFDTFADSAIAFSDGDRHGDDLVASGLALDHLVGRTPGRPFLLHRDLGTHLLAITLFYNAHGHATGAEALDLYLLAEFLQAAIHFLLDLGFWNLDSQAALKPAGVFN